VRGRVGLVIAPGKELNLTGKLVRQRRLCCVRGKQGKALSQQPSPCWPTYACCPAATGNDIVLHLAHFVQISGISSPASVEDCQSLRSTRQNTQPRAVGDRLPPDLPAKQTDGLP
jgi:hypothetical protein